MVLFFNLRLLEAKTNNDSEYMVVALNKLFKNIKVPKSSTEKYKPIPNLERGTSFLLNPKKLFTDKSTDIIYKAQYIKLAGRRDYNLYIQYKSTTLDLSLYPDINIQAIKYNPLIEITENTLKFKYEDKNGN